MKKCFLLFVLALAGLPGIAQHTNRARDLSLSEKIAEMEQENYRRMNESALREVSVASENFDINFYRCEWKVDPAVQYIDGKVTTYFAISSSSNSITFDLSSVLQVDSVIFRNAKISFTQTPNDGLTLQFGQNLNTGQRDSVSVYYHGSPVTSTGSFAINTHNGKPVMWTLSEPFGAKDWWPCKNGNNDKADSIDIIITNPLGYTASSIGMMTHESDNGGTHSTWFKHRYPVTSYLVAFSVTDFVVINDSVKVGDKMMPFISYAFPEDEPTFRFGIEDTKRAMGVYSSLLGDYPFNKEKYGHTQFLVGGGMEHQTNSFIGYVSVKLTTHELAHQWFGDKVTCGSWHDIWLNEGIASYMDWYYAEKYYPDYLMPDRQYYTAVVIQKPDGSVWVSDTTNKSVIFSNRLTYTKGAFVLHMLRWKFGDSTFFRALRQYLNDPLLKFGYAKTKDFQRNFEQVTGQNLESYFQKWVYGQGNPNYQVSWSVNKNNWIKVKLNQTTTHPSVSFYDLPVPIQFKNASRDTTIVFDHTWSGQDFWINIGFIPDTVIFDPEIRILSGKNTVSKVAPVSQKDNELKIYPNPSPVYLNIQLQNPDGKKLYVQFFNAAGQLLQKREIQTPGRDELITIPTSQLPRGVYWLRISNDNGFNQVRKIVH